MAAGDTLTVVMPQGGTYKSTISEISGDAITVDPPLTSVPVVGAIWVCESATLKTQLFRVLSVAEKDGITFEITATQHEPGKYAAIDSGAVIDVQPITENTFTSQSPPSGVACSQYVVTDQGIAKTNLTISWAGPANAVSYRVQFQRDSGTWVDAGTTGQTSIDVSNIYLSGQITSSQLSKDLLTPIQAIPSLQMRMTASETAVSTETSARQAADAALSSRLDSVTAVFNPPEAGSLGDYAGATTAFAGVWSEQYARAAADSALATRVDTVEAKVNSVDLGPVYAAIQTETNARVSADSANASQITTLQASVSKNSAAIQTNSNAYADLSGKVSASYTVKMQVTTNGQMYAAGFGLGIDNSSGTVQSQFLVTAERFAVLEPTGQNLFSPFVIQNGQAFINKAFIGTGWITNAMIGNVIQSSAVGANGQPRWILDKSGTLTLNGANSGSGYMTINDSTVRVYDTNGTLRVRLGLW